MLVFLLLVTLSAVVLGDDVADRAMVLARKSVTSEFKQPVGAEELTNVIVENRNFTVTVSLYNVGGQEAFEIEVEDEWEYEARTTHSLWLMGLNEDGSRDLPIGPAKKLALRISRASPLANTDRSATHVA